MNINREVKHTFYTSKAWKQLRDYKLFVQPYCECYDCVNNYLETDADEVHHVKDIDSAWHLRLTYSNLMSVHHDHHSSITMTGINKLKQAVKQSIKYDATTTRLMAVTNCIST